MLWAPSADREQQRGRTWPGPAGCPPRGRGGRGAAFGGLGSGAGAALLTCGPPRRTAPAGNRPPAAGSPPRPPPSRRDTSALGGRRRAPSGAGLRPQRRPAARRSPCAGSVIANKQTERKQTAGKGAKSAFRARGWLQQVHPGGTGTEQLSCAVSGRAERGYRPWAWAVSPASSVSRARSCRCRNLTWNWDWELGMRSMVLSFNGTADTQRGASWIYLAVRPEVSCTGFKGFLGPSLELTCLWQWQRALHRERSRPAWHHPGGTAAGHCELPDPGNVARAAEALSLSFLTSCCFHSGCFHWPWQPLCDSAS